MNLINYNLPEYVMFDGNNGEENTLSNRVVIMHVRTLTIVDVIDKGKALIYDFKSKMYYFEHKANNYFMVSHFSTIEDNKDLESIINGIKVWYINFLDNNK